MKYYRSMWIILILLLGACSTIQKTPIPATAPAAASPKTSAYPAPSSSPVATNGTSYPSPMASSITTVPTSTADKTMGSAHGVLLLNGKPVDGALLLLADIVKDKNGVDSVVSVELNTKNRARTISDGSFSFINVPPQRYTLMLSVVNNSYVLYKPGTQNLIIINVEPDGSADLGSLNYDALPITP
jgi:hypothetical protein